MAIARRRNGPLLYGRRASAPLAGQSWQSAMRDNPAHGMFFALMAGCYTVAFCSSAKAGKAKSGSAAPQPLGDGGPPTVRNGEYSAWCGASTLPVGYFASWAVGSRGPLASVARRNGLIILDDATSATMAAQPFAGSRPPRNILAFHGAPRVCNATPPPQHISGYWKRWISYLPTRRHPPPQLLVLPDTGISTITRRKPAHCARWARPQASTS